MLYIAETMASEFRARSAGGSSSPSEQDAVTYTIDELAAVARVPSRTIRFYQSKGALMPPEIRGRVAYYGAAHLERLKLIAQLQERGLRIDAIRGLVRSIERGELDIAEWLGVERQLAAPWAQDQARTVSEPELLQLLGTTRPGVVSDLTRAKLVERRGDVYLIESPMLLSIALKLDAAGIDLHTAAEAGEVLRKHLRRAVAELSELLLKRLRDGGLATVEPAKLFETLRPVAIDAVRVLFAKQAERALRKLVESGALAAVPSRGRRKKTR